MTEQGVTERRIFDYLYSVNAKFVVRVLELHPPPSFFNESGGVYHFGEEVNDGVHGMHGEVSLWLCGM